MRIGINGMGRIGRCILRAIALSSSESVSFLQINSSANKEDLIHAIKYDSVHGRLNLKIESQEGTLFSVNGIKCELLSNRDISKYKWKEIDVVMECTGKMKKYEDLNLHIKSGAKAAILSSIGKDPNLPTFVFGVNQDKMTKDDNIVSIGSCTTNCAAPLIKLIHDELRVKKAFITTIHSYTSNQSLLDVSCDNRRRARAASLSIIPTSTGASKIIDVLIPDLKGKIDGSAIRVPTPNVSMIDCSIFVEKGTTKESLNQIIKDKSKESLFSNAISYTEEELVSIDFNGNPYSSICDLPETKIVDKDMVRVISWYDNEFGFSMRMLDTAKRMKELSCF